MTDGELVRRAIEDPEQFAPIVEQYERMLLRFVQGLSQLSYEDAEDLTQQVFLKAYDHLRDFDPNLKLSTWLMRIARNEVIDLWRKRKARPQESELNEEILDDSHFSEPTFAKEFDQKLTSHRVRELLTLLKPEYREVLYLSFFEEKSYDEIADIIRKPPGTVAALISRAKKAFEELSLRTGEIQKITNSL